MADAPQPKGRWYRLTPDRCVLGLLVLEGFLLLSEQFRWFSFNQRKGWTVLIALAAVGLTLLLMFLWFLAALLFRLRFQYNLRSLLVLVVVVAIPCSWLATARKWARRQQEAVAALRTAGGAVTYDFDKPDDPFTNEGPPPPPTWLRKTLGDDFCADIDSVKLAETQVTDAGLVHLEGLVNSNGWTFATPRSPMPG